VDGANIRWGLHSEHRSSLDLPEGLERNTWQAGLRRMLLGYGAGRDDPWQGIEPFEEIGGLQAGVAGNLYRFVDRLEELWHELRSTATPAGWLDRLQSILERFFAELSDDDLLLVNRLRRQAEQWLQDCNSAGMEDVELPLSIVREILLEGLEEGGLNQRFLAGKVNFATLMPMRAIPFRRVCLLGMNDGDYPRSRPPVDFDLMAVDYRPGDRSRREAEQQYFLELARQEKAEREAQRQQREAKAWHGLVEAEQLAREKLQQAEDLLTAARQIADSQGSDGGRRGSGDRS
jgi:exodeoxyribonuclease V gamma subunit